MLTLRPYQDDLVARTRAAIAAGARTVLIQAPTGAGKTALVAHILASASVKGRRGWFINHRRELLRQSWGTLTESANVRAGFFAAGWPADPEANVQVCSIQSLGRRAARLAPPHLIVWDEAHHVASKTWARLMTAYPQAVHIGITATPSRLDGSGLGRWFHALIVGPSTRELIAAGWLSDYKLYAPASAMDLSAVHTIAGDYNRRELGEAMAKAAVVGDAVAEYRAKADGKRALAFVWSLDASRALAARFCAAGIPAEHVDGDTDARQRDGAMARFRAGQTLVLCNVELFGEGLDVPGIECVILLRPTQSLGLYCQQIGRSLRAAPGKTHAIILDHVHNSKLHGLPDDDRLWTLEGDKRRRARDAAAPIRQCPACYAVVPAAATACRYCGYEFQPEGREVAVLAGELAEVDVAAARAAAKHEVARARDRDALEAIRVARGYAPGWTHYVMEARRKRYRHQVDTAADEARSEAQIQRRAREAAPINPHGTIKEWKGEA